MPINSFYCKYLSAAIFEVMFAGVNNIDQMDQGIQMVQALLTACSQQILDTFADENKDVNLVFSWCKTDMLVVMTSRPAGAVSAC
jgi:hypothetical protein